MQVRRSIRELEAEYDAGNKKPLEDLIRAWKGIQELPHTDLNSFFTIAGYHGEPFRGAGWANADWWGGYCNHGNVLFPTWHRAYLHRLEKALQSIPGCADVTLPYWDEIDDISFKEGLPPIFLKKKFKLDGDEIKNPLYSYIFQAGVYDNLGLFSAVPDADYSKPPGYETVRYPYSGLVGTADAAATKVHNQQYEDMPEDQVNKLLNTNISEWLGPSVTLDTGDVRTTNTRYLYHECLKAPNYTAFSNTSSVTQWNEDHFNIMPGSKPDPQVPVVVSLESPHNRMHLAIGGFELPKLPGNDADRAPGANGDMGENDTSSFDPIFFFHHCFIDKMFWNWQINHGKTKGFDIIPGYPGTNSIDAQGPTPGTPANVWLTMETPLDPFEKADGKTPMTSNDVVDIETQLGYTYIIPRPLPRSSVPLIKPPTLRVHGANRAAIDGSFMVSTWVADPTATDPNNKKLINLEAVLSRRHVSGCANCQTHLTVKTFVPLYGLSPDEAEKAEFEVRVHTREDPKGESIQLPKPDLKIHEIVA